MDFCQIGSCKNLAEGRKCVACELWACFEHGEGVSFIFQARPTKPYQHLNTYQSVLLLFAWSDFVCQYRGGGSYLYFHDTILPVANLPEDVTGYFCKGCAEKKKQELREKIKGGLFSALCQAKNSGFICKIHGLCLYDVHNGLRCYNCRRTGCYAHLKYCQNCKNIVCALPKCMERHRRRHPLDANTKLVVLDRMT